ncbi:acetyltransferase [Cyanobium sp. ATX 6E8]|uniref:acetyltransferase n=1 Tax=Cyanobium sp. ATX 6E8 TaxID=2823701 RepID=UPI0020CF605B|nr:acetyltransferase [Cyanobium sp. ATX 6E8]MCP9941433.1 acetyltransferase [Cyanobium sp. ATX 6E8]
MFLKLRDADDESLVEVLDLKQLLDPFVADVLVRLHAGEELQDPGPVSKDHLVFPSGEALPRCWVQLSGHD